MSSRVLRVLVVILAILISVSVVGADQVVKFHNHTHHHDDDHSDCYGSDGSDNIWEMGAKAAEEGFGAFVISDHLDEVLRNNPTGIEDYIRWIVEYNKYPKPLPEWAQARNGKARFCYCVSGVEIALDASSHTLFVAPNPNVLREVAAIAGKARYDEHPEWATRVLLQLAELAERTGSVMIAAHPTHRGIVSYTYDLPLSFVRGLEVMNCGEDVVSEVFNLIPRLLTVPLCFEAGQDDHGTAISMLDRAQRPVVQGIFHDIQDRRTVVLTDNFSEIVGCLKQGRCYATEGVAILDPSGTMPGDKFDPNASDILSIKVLGLPVLRLERKVRVVAVEKGTGRASYAACILQGAMGEINIPLKATLQPELGNGGWYLYLDICDKVFVSAIEIPPFRLQGVPPVKPLPIPAPTPSPSPVVPTPIPLPAIDPSVPPAAPPNGMTRWIGQTTSDEEKGKLFPAVMSGVLDISPGGSGRLYTSFNGWSGAYDVQLVQGATWMEWSRTINASYTQPIQSYERSDIQSTITRLKLTQRKDNAVVVYDLGFYFKIPDDPFREIEHRSIMLRRGG